MRMRSTGARACAWLAATALSLAGLYLVLRRPIAEADISSTAMPHADHRPKHGGLFFMAPDSFHHVEGTLEGREFRVYLYDNFTRPIDARGFQARVGSHAMAAEPNGRYLRLQIEEPTTTPPRVTAFVRFIADGREEKFDFIFTGKAERFLLTQQP